MPRICLTCTHPKVDEINNHIISQDMTMNEIALKYGIDVDALARHKKNHLRPMIEKAINKLEGSVEEAYLDTLRAYNMIIEELPELLEKGSVSITQVLEALAKRSELLGETTSAPKIELVWGLGTNQNLLDERNSRDRLAKIAEGRENEQDRREDSEEH